MKNQKLRVLVEIAIFAALAFILDLLIPSFNWAIKPSFKMLPIVILALRWGVGPGLAGGLVWGLLQIITGEAYILNVLQVFIEYIFAFAAIGFAGLFQKQIQHTLRSENVKLVNAGLLASFATIVGSFVRYIFHFIAGIIFWGEYAPEGQSPALYSFLTNGSAFLTETVTCIIILWLMVPVYKSVILNKNLE